MASRQGGAKRATPSSAGAPLPTPASEAAAAVADLIVTKKATRLTLRPTHLLGKSGMWRIYNEFPSLPLKRKEGSEVRQPILHHCSLAAVGSIGGHHHSPTRILCGVF